MTGHPRLALACLALALACERGDPSATATPGEPAVAPATTLVIDYQPALGEAIAAAGYLGTFVVLDPATHTLIVAEPPPAPGHASMAETRFVPASTFKIPSSIIALETGVAEGPEFALAWDGVAREVEAWNRDHVLRSAYASSVVWFYQALARRIGPERMQSWVDRFDYGNRSLAGAAIDEFWLRGPLAISPREQVEFLQRLHAGALPISERTRTIMLDDIMIHERREGGTIVRAKTGWASSETRNIGWFVGSVERPEQGIVMFACLIVAGPEAPAEFAEQRRSLAYAALGRLGILEGNLTPPR
jgi:beta-lactamase class D